MNSSGFESLSRRLLTLKTVIHDSLFNILYSIALTLHSDPKKPSLSSEPDVL